MGPRVLARDRLRYEIGPGIRARGALGEFSNKSLDYDKIRPTRKSPVDDLDDLRGGVSAAPRPRPMQRTGPPDDKDAVKMESTIPRLVFGAAERFKDSPAIEDGDVRLSFAELADEPKLVALKESSDDPRRITDIVNACGDRYLLFCGVDDLVLESQILGAIMDEGDVSQSELVHHVALKREFLRRGFQRRDAPAGQSDGQGQGARGRRASL